MLGIEYKGQFEIVSFYDLDIKQQDDIKNDYGSVDESSFFIDSHDNVHDLNSFMHIVNNDSLKSFHGYDSTAFFHSYLIILDESGDSVKLFDYNV